MWADGGDAGHLVAWGATVGGSILAIVRRPEGQVGYPVAPRRRVSAPTIAWLG